MLNSLQMPTRWKLGQYLEANGITVYELAKLPALKTVTGKDVKLTDLLEYQDDLPDA